MINVTKHMVAYIDILGSKDAILHDHNDYYLNTINTCFERVKANTSWMRLSGTEGCTIKIFSDNIVIAIPSDFACVNNNHPTIVLNRMHAALCAIQREFLKHEILIRGGLSFGKLYIDDIFIWGKALIDAYNVEDGIAIYPRIVIDQSIHVLNAYRPDPAEMYESNCIRADFDGCYYFDYLRLSMHPENTEMRDLVENSMCSTAQKISIEENQRKLAKYQWHYNYLAECKSKWI